MAGHASPLEEHTGLEPAQSAWKAEMLPLHQCSVLPVFPGCQPKLDTLEVYFGVSIRSWRPGTDSNRLLHPMPKWRTSLCASRSCWRWALHYGQGPIQLYGAAGPKEGEDKTRRETPWDAAYCATRLRGMVCQVTYLQTITNPESSTTALAKKQISGITVLFPVVMEYQDRMAQTAARIKHT